MKIVFKLIGIFAGIAVATIIAWTCYEYVFPYMQARTQYAKDYPTIEILNQEIISRNIEIDSLNHRIENLEQQVELQNRIIEERNLQSTISRQLKNLQNSYNESKH